MHVHPFIDELIHLRGIGRKTDAPSIIDDSNAHHPRLMRHVRDDVVETVALVAQHIVRSIPLDNVAHAASIRERGALQVFSVKLDVQIAEYAEHNGHRRNKQQK